MELFGNLFLFYKAETKGYRINDRAEKRTAPCWGEREGSNLILFGGGWVCVWVCAHVCVRTCAQCEGTVGMGQEGCAVEWSLQSQKQWGVSPDGLIPGRPLKEGLDQKKPSWLAIHTQVPPRGPWVIILPSASFTDAGNKMFSPFFPCFLLIALMF